MKTKVYLLKERVSDSKESRFSITLKSTGVESFLRLEGESLILTDVLNHYLERNTATEEFLVVGDVLHAKFGDREIVVTFADDNVDGVRFLRAVERAIFNKELYKSKVQHNACKRELRESNKALLDLESELERYRELKPYR